MVADLGLDMSYFVALGSDEIFRANSLWNKKPFLQSSRLELEDHEPLRKLAVDPRILSPVAHYLGSKPVLADAVIWYSPNDQELVGGSQFYHFDNFDTRQVRCVFPLTEITERSGPLTIFEADESERIYRKLIKSGRIKRRSTKVLDEWIYPLTIKDPIQVMAGPGSVIFVDTDNCFHYGSRPAPESRMVLMLEFCTSGARDLPLWGRKPKTWNTASERSVFGLNHLFFYKARSRVDKARAESLDPGDGLE
jgi:hypothetical protein